MPWCTWWKRPPTERVGVAGTDGGAGHAAEAGGQQQRAGGLKVGIVVVEAHQVLAHELEGLYAQALGYGVGLGVDIALDRVCERVKAHGGDEMLRRADEVLGIDNRDIRRGLDVQDLRLGVLLAVDNGHEIGDVGARTGCSRNGYAGQRLLGHGVNSEVVAGFAAVSGQHGAGFGGIQRAAAAESYDHVTVGLHELGCRCINGDVVGVELRFVVDNIWEAYLVHGLEQVLEVVQLGQAGVGDDEGLADLQSFFGRLEAVGQVVCEYYPVGAQVFKLSNAHYKRLSTQLRALTDS